MSYNNNNDIIHSSISDKKFDNKPWEIYKDIPIKKLSSLESKIKIDNDFPTPYD